MLFLLLTKIAEGFLVKTIASFDDILTRIPVISYLTKTKRGRIAFSIGSLLALTVVLMFAVFFSSLLNLIPHTRIIASGLIFALAVFVYLEIFSSKPKEKITSKLKSADVTSTHFLKLIGMGFVVSFVTLIDDAIVFVPLFLEDNLIKFMSIIGIYAATIIQLFIVIYFGHKLSKIKYKKEMASGALLILSILVFTGII